MAQLKDSDEKKPKVLSLFGGDEGWDAEDWTASDDRSYLEYKEDTARFYGTLDIKTLGGAGFASQRTTGDERKWDLSEYAGIRLTIAEEKRYTFILKDTLQPPNVETAREQATISWECDFELPPQDEEKEATNHSLFIPWDSLVPTYRGKVKKDAESLDLKRIKRMSIMMRSISALSKAPPPNAISASAKKSDDRTLEAGTIEPDERQANDGFFATKLAVVKASIHLHKRTLCTLAVLLALWTTVRVGRNLDWRR
ncbi:hypothetical protein LTR37_000676 [Vermiconidia calcicola]|uniref:Uncharacterized protein n=1 Tax=Vermiconidia calcicola TaxID=1690605 RepID=A0ACC3NY40_9PEZI|nr:hypothetical protein LTR37_000676 [Vermiconidia calcicola]